jgi:hypothetical protein
VNATLHPVQRLEARLNVCKSRVEEADRQRSLAERAGNGTRAGEWKLNAYYHGGEVAALNFALATMPPERAVAIAVDRSRSSPDVDSARTPP